MSKIKNEIISVVGSLMFIPVLIPTYIAYHLLFDEDYFINRKPKQKTPTRQITNIKDKDNNSLK